MATRFGDINIDQIIENEFRIGVLERILEFVLNNNPTSNRPDSETIKKIRLEVVANLQKKYPRSGLALKAEEGSAF